MTPDTSVLLSRESLTVGALPRWRNPYLVYAFGAFTLGLYWVVWFCRVNRDLRAFDERIAVRPGWETTAFALGWPVGIPQFLTLRRTARRIEDAQRAAGIPATCDAGTTAAMWLCFGVGVIYLQDELNKVVDRFGAPAGTEVFHFA